MLDERLETKEKNVIASIAKQSIIILFVATFFSACTDYVQQIEDRYGEWETSDEVSSSSSVKAVDPADVVVGSMTDSRDGQTYKTVSIGTQTWMAQNLNYKTEDSYCYNDDSANCTKYGRLYTWAAAITACLSGWHLPSGTEWNTLISVVGGSSTAGAKLKSSSGWTGYGNGTDAFSFSALPAGDRDYYGGSYCEGLYANFWSSTGDDRYACLMHLNHGDDAADLRNSYKIHGHSVRCLQD